jgi:hypothetical protein
MSTVTTNRGVGSPYPKFPHGRCPPHADAINTDLLAFIKA